MELRLKSNINTIAVTSGKYRWNSSTTGRPADTQANEYGTLLHLNYDGDIATQLAYDIAESNLYIRHLTTSTDTGSTWKRVVTSSDAIGTLDGYTQSEVDNLVDSRLPLTGGALTGDVTITSGDNALWTIDNGTGTSWRGRIGHKNSTADTSAFLGSYDSNAGVFAHNNALTAWDDLYVNTVDGTNGGNVRLPSGTYMAGNLVATQSWVTSQSYQPSGTYADGTTYQTYGTGNNGWLMPDYDGNASNFMRMYYDDGSREFRNVFLSWCFWRSKTCSLQWCFMECNDFQ